MSRRILLSVVATNLALAAWAIGWSALVGLADLPADPGRDPGGRRGDRRLDALHPAPVRGHLLPAGRRVAVRARRAPGELLPEAPAGARLGGRQRQLPPRASPQRQDPELPPARRTRGAADVRRHPGRHPTQRPRRAATEAVGRGTGVAGRLSGAHALPRPQGAASGAPPSPSPPPGRRWRGPGRRRGRSACPRGRPEHRPLQPVPRRRRPSSPARRRATDGVARAA